MLPPVMLQSVPRSHWRFSGTSSTDSVVLGDRARRNAKVTDPSLTIAPSESARGSISRSPSSHVPFLLPRSSSTDDSPIVIRAWRLEIVGKSISTIPSPARPTMFSPAWSANATRVAHEPCGRVVDPRSRGPAAREDVPLEAIADPTHRADPGVRIVWGVDGLPDFVDQRLDAGLGHEGRGPESLVDLLLRHDGGPGVEQQEQQVERLGGQMHRSGSTGHAASRPIDTDAAEDVLHDAGLVRLRRKVLHPRKTRPACRAEQNGRPAISPTRAVKRRKRGKTGRSPQSATKSFAGRSIRNRDCRPNRRGAWHGQRHTVRL